MGRKPRRTFSDEQKKNAVDDYVSGRKTAGQVAKENEVPVGVIYRWRVQMDERVKTDRIDELENKGATSQMARKILELEAEMEEYQKKVAQQSVIIDLLKKLQTPRSLQPGSELTGLLDTMKKSGRSKKRVK
jgi:transposase-like protein